MNTKEMKYKEENWISWTGRESGNKGSEHTDTDVLNGWRVFAFKRRFT